MLHDPLANKFWGRLYTEFPEFQFALKDIDSGSIFSAGNCIPIYYDRALDELPETGWDWAIEKGFSDRENGKKPNLLCALSITIHPTYIGQGYSVPMIRAMSTIGMDHQLTSLIAPVRPNHKHKYPLISIDNYIHWKNSDGLPYDPWLRVHQRLGAVLKGPCHRAMTIRGSINEWRKWTSLIFPESGEYIIPGALNPVSINVEKDVGEYIEPNVWMVHPLK